MSRMTALFQASSARSESLNASTVGPKVERLYEVVVDFSDHIGRLAKVVAEVGAPGLVQRFFEKSNIISTQLLPFCSESSRERLSNLSNGYVSTVAENLCQTAEEAVQCASGVAAGHLLEHLRKCIDTLQSEFGTDGMVNPNPREFVPTRNLAVIYDTQAISLDRAPWQFAPPRNGR